MGNEIIVGKSKIMQNVMKLVEKVSASDVTVLITGESGTGKELIANTIYKLSNRNNKPFIKLNCAAIPTELLESQMFGHEKGAFTGAIARQEGCFERANHGVLFLDEIGDMSLTTQTKLLRVLQEKEFERIGGKETIKVDVRLIAATNKNLLEEIKHNRFREDLYYRLNVVEIALPPLRDRIEDLEDLVEYFLKLFSRKYKKENITISSEAMHVLRNYSWPGNIRELRNVIERAVVLSHGNVIEPQDFPDKIRVPISFTNTPFTEGSILTLEQLERLYIQKVLEFTGGNKLKAARLLDIDPKTLRAKLQSMNNERKDKNV